METERSNQISLTIEEARGLARESVIKLGYVDAEAAIIADHLIDAELCGYGYSGLAKILNIAANPRSKKQRRPLTVVRENAVSALVDGGNNLGMLSVHRATSIAIDKAKQSGIAVVGVYDTFNSGRNAYYLELIAQADLLGIHFVSSSPQVAPLGGANRILGTNPIAFGIPTANDPLIFDMGTAAIMGSDFMLKERLHELLPEGVAIDREGNPTRDPAKARAGSLLTFGGYKGFGLSLCIQMMGLLAGAASADEKYYGFVLLAIDPAMLVPLDVFKREATALIEKIKSAPRQPGVAEIRLPSERAMRERAMRQQAGTIVIARPVYDALRSMPE